MSRSRPAPRVTSLFPNAYANDVRLAWALGPLALVSLGAAILSAGAGGSLAVFGTLAFTSVALGLAVVTVRMITQTGGYAPLHAKRTLPVVRSPRSREPMPETFESAESAPAALAVPAAPAVPAVPDDDSGVRRWTHELLAELPAERFEAVCVAYFRRLGFRATIRSSGRGQGVDIRLHLDGAGSAPVNLVRCRASNEIGVNDVREFIAAMNHHRVPRGIFVAAQGFRSSARGLAEVNRIFVMSAEELLAKIHERPTDEQIELLRLALDGEEAIAA